MEGELIDFLAVLVLGTVAYFFPTTSHRPHSPRARLLVFLVAVFFVAIDVISYLNSGRSLIDNAACIVVPHAKGCASGGAHVASPSPSLKPFEAPPAVAPSPVHAQETRRDAVEPPKAAEPITDAPPHFRILSATDSKDIWSTNVYSYAPGGGGPGGGQENEFLRVGGFGDEYVTLIQFDLPKADCGRSIQLELYNVADGAAPTAMYLNIIEAGWSWPPGDRLWWRDLPRAEPWRNQLIAAPGYNAWSTIDLTDLAKSWCNGERPNNGIMLRPVRNSNNYNHFMSTRALDASLRPRLLIGS